MEYTVQKLAQIAGISTRTLRYYDEIGILRPARINSSGYRIYGSREIDILQQILFYRELGVGLEEIKNIIMSPDFDEMKALAQHREKLIEKRAQLDSLIENVDMTISSRKGDLDMSAREKFEGFKKKIIDENENKYGNEIRGKYGDQAVDDSNRNIENMTREEYDQVSELADQVTETLRLAFETGDPSSEPAQRCADLHRQWLSFYWKNYTKEAHAGIAQMYVDDGRFTAYYDRDQPGMAKFLRDAIFIYTEKK